MKVDAIFIDDEKYLRMGWELKAKSAGVSLNTYASPEEFQSLGQNVEFAKELYEEGYQNIYLATGEDPSEFKNAYWIKQVVGKSPPAWPAR